jgi:hypothetical protein
MVELRTLRHREFKELAQVTQLELGPKWSPSIEGAVFGISQIS